MGARKRLAESGFTLCRCGELSKIRWVHKDPYGFSFTREE